MFRPSRRRMRLARRFAQARRMTPGLEKLESRQLLASQPYVVNVTDDSTAAGTLRSAILAANQDADPDPFDIVFNIPASTAPELNVPVPGFDPVNQTWTITLNSPLPVITHPISIDGFSQAHDDVPYRYSDEITSAVQTLTVLGGTDWRHVHVDHVGAPSHRHDRRASDHSDRGSGAGCPRGDRRCRQRCSQRRESTAGYAVDRISRGLRRRAGPESLAECQSGGRNNPKRRRGNRNGRVLFRCRARSLQRPTPWRRSTATTHRSG